MKEEKTFSILIIIISIAVFCSYHIYYYVIDKTNDNLVRDYNTINKEKDEIKVSKIDKKEETYLAILEIPKINLIEGFYNIDSNKNTVNKHVTLLKESVMPNEKGSIIYLAAHSGTGYIAYFKDINKLSIGDTLNIKYQNKTYSYSINDIYEMPKNGTITVNHNIHENYLVLTTCSKNKNRQLVITGKLVNKI